MILFLIVKKKKKKNLLFFFFFKKKTFLVHNIKISKGEPGPLPGGKKKENVGMNELLFQIIDLLFFSLFMVVLCQFFKQPQKISL